ncbi:MAG: hypothetical protein MUC36_25450 [Planctomycetes bacterium]|jgi:tetratricopeptide (TPR) repeat protein|nr:hypothetical protein [Planctomycetota bacterium]
MRPRCTGRLVSFAAVALAAACATAPRDPFLRAERAMQQRELAMALAAYDSVPVAHPRYPEARAAAAAVELSIRHGHELLLEALQLRAQWRCGEALTVLERVRSVWPSMPGLDALVDATEQRLQLFEREPAAAAPAAEVMVVEAPPPKAPLPPDLPVSESMLATSATAAFETPVAAGEVVEVVAPPAAGADRQPVVTPALRLQTPAPIVVPPVDDPVAKALVAVEARLLRREIEPAVLELLDLERRHPGDLRIRPRLAKLLHQRALLRYGSGLVEPALRDWERVLVLDPSHGEARDCLQRAIAERGSGR